MAKRNLKQSIQNISHTVETYSIVVLFISVVFSLYETYSNNKTTSDQLSQLENIRTSISTRHIGIFPNYLPQINNLLSDVDTPEPIIIFEDVLYYGVFSAPHEFKKMTYRLLELSKTNQITIVYYDIDGRAFKKGIQESRIKQQYLGKIENDRRALLTQYRQNNTFRARESLYNYADSIVSEKYFAYSREDKAFKQKVQQYLTPLYDAYDKDSLFFRIDEVKNNNLGKNPDAITFNDFYKTYRGISEELITVFKEKDVELIGINDFHVMSCWQHDDKAILAFPSKYATDEIGFFTQDPIFQKYIFTMLEGVRGQISVDNASIKE
jgi:hypothetical protein